MLRIYGEQTRIQVPPKLFGVNSWIPQMIMQWILHWHTVDPVTENVWVRMCYFNWKRRC